MAADVLVTQGARSSAGMVYILVCMEYSLLNTLRPRKMDAIFQTTFSNAFSSMKMYEFLLKFHEVCS